MNDWRLINQEYFKGLKLKKIKFPEFWEKSYLIRNDFYDMIRADAESFVSKYGDGREYLIGEKIEEFWHSHCVFCTEKITTKENKICYCSEDYKDWVCNTCYEDFKDPLEFELIYDIATNLEKEENI